MLWMKIDLYVKKIIFLVNYKVRFCFFNCIYFFFILVIRKIDKKSINKKNIGISMICGVFVKFLLKFCVWY